MNETTTAASKAWSVVAGVALGATMLVLFYVLAGSPVLLVWLLGLAAEAALAAACFYAAWRMGILGERHIARWAEVAAWVVIAVTLILAVLRAFPAIHSTPIVVTLLVAPAIVGSILQNWPRALVAVEAALCGAYLLATGPILADVASDMSGHGYALFYLLSWPVRLLASMTWGATVVRRLRSWPIHE